MTSREETSPISQSSFTFERLRRVLAYCASYALSGLLVGTIGPTLPDLAAQTGTTLGQISLIFPATSIGYVFGALLSGRLYDRLPGQPVIASANLGIAGLLILVPLMPGLWLLQTVMLLVGFFTAFQDVGSNTLIIWLYGRKAGPYTNALQFAFGLGAFLAPILVDRVFARDGGIRWVFWLQAVLVSLVAFWLTRLQSPTQRTAEKSGDSIRSKARNGTSLLVLMIAMLLGLHLGTELGYGDWIFSYAVAFGVGSHTLARLLNSVYWGALTLGRLFAIPLASRLLPRTMLLIDLIGAGLSMGIILLFPGSLVALWIGTFGFGLSLASFYASTINFAERRIPISGRITGYILVGSIVGEMILPWFIGQLFVSVGPQILMITMQVAVMLSLVLFAGTLVHSRRFHQAGVTETVTA